MLSLCSDYTNHSIVICGVCKNVAPYLPNMIKKIEALGSCFANYAVLIYENNSIDTTKKLLHEWQKTNEKVSVITEDLTERALHNRTYCHALKDDAPCRMELIAHARNTVLRQALSTQFDDYSYIIMTDLDFLIGWDVDGVLSCFTKDIDWDCMVANSMGGGRYYDRYAYRDQNFPFGPEMLGENFWRLIAQNPFAIEKNQPPYKIYSGFGGIAVYKRKSLYNCTYSGVVTEDFKTFMHHILNNEIDKTNRSYDLYKKIIKKNTTPIPVIFKNNSGYNGPTVCEHSILHAQMYLHGHNKIYLNPRMLCFY